MALGGPLDLEELQFLVQKDGDRLVCSGCGQEFQPVRRAVVTERLLNDLRAGRDLLSLEEEIRWAGSFIVKIVRGNPEVIHFCGSMFYFDPKRRVTDGSEFYAVSRQSCLGQAFLCDENRNKEGESYPAYSYEAAQAFILKWEENRRLRAEEFRKRQ